MLIFYGISHMLVGMIVGYYSGKFIGLTYKEMFVFVGFMIIGSLLPDADHPNSILGRWFFLIAFPLAGLMKHRGIFHTILAGLLFSIFAWIYNDLAWVGFIIGYMLHLLCDTLNYTGIMWLYPFNKNKYSWKIMRSGDEILIVVMIFVMLFW